MEGNFITLGRDNLESEHLCCAIADKKHQCGVAAKKDWLQDRLAEGHVFRKLDEKGKVFIEYAPLETAWVPVTGENYLYIYCLWVSGKFKGRGYGKALLESCLDDARQQGKSGVCVLSAKKKKPYLSDKKFMEQFGFTAVDAVADYELLACSFDGSKPRFSETARKNRIEEQELTVYYGKQCPFAADCAAQLQRCCDENQIPLRLIPVDTLLKAKTLPCVFNNWAVFYQGEFQTVQLLNENQLQKMLSQFGG